MCKWGIVFDTTNLHVGSCKGCATIGTLVDFKIYLIFFSSLTQFFIVDDKPIEIIEYFLKIETKLTTVYEFLIIRLKEVNNDYITELKISGDKQINIFLGSRITIIREPEVKK